MVPSEIQYVANYLSQLVLTPEQQQRVCSVFAEKLCARFLPRHWFPLQPERGSGFRAVSFDPNRQDGYLDPVLCILAQLLGVSTREFRRCVLANLATPYSFGWTIWSDPGCVSIRLQASGGEIKELWGNLPAHLSHPRPGFSTPPTLPPAPRLSPPVYSPSPNKSRAIPILAPPGVARLAVIPPTPVTPDSRRSHSEGSEEEERQDMLVDDFQDQYKLPSYCSSFDDPFLRPSSRTSCASSSSDGSDHSGFSSSSSSTATSIAPLGILSNKKMSYNSIHGQSFHQLPTGYIRHHSSNSLPFVTMNSLPSAGLAPLAPLSTHVRRSASPALTGQRRRHMASASVSSVGGGRGLLVLKEGPGTVTEHSGGKVGVMGGGVLLGIPKDKDSALAGNAGTRRVANRRTRTGPAHA